MNWLITGGLGPAVVALPVNWSAGRVGGLARRWLDQIRHEDGLSRLILAADPLVRLTGSELAAVRRLLEDPHAWRRIGSGTVEELAAEISACLREGEDAAGDRVKAGRAIARGLLEFAVFDLEPQLFQRVLMARIARMESRLADKLDETVLELHAGLSVWFACQEQADELRIRRVLFQLGHVLDRLPPGPAGRDVVSLYLAALIGWLNTDPWPRDPRLGGPVLTPASIERRLAISGEEKSDQDEDDLAERCTRLVVLGGPGSGKTWLARRIARRCAEAALEALTRGGGLDEVELPLFTTCSLLVTAKGGIRDAAVASALEQLGDLGGSRITDALRVFLTERNTPTLLVIDSLDEARDPDDRLRQASTLPWRVILTSRPSSWNQQLAIDAKNPLHKVGSLRALRYPEDVEALVARWFAAADAQGRALIAQIASRKDVQLAATVPLILAFYCIIGGEAPLPETRHEVYALVLSQLLSGLWRKGGDVDADPAARTAILRDWAWAGAAKDKTTKIGTWADEVFTPYVKMSPPDRAAVDHVASPVGLPGLSTGATLRRFIHRSIREHLTAEYVATQMNSDEAAAELVNHLWYDPDWEYTAPAALAMHPHRDRVLKELICQAALSSDIPDDLASIDGCWELRRFLARVASESRENDWTAESAAIIGRARLDVAANELFGLSAAPGWPTLECQIRREVLNKLDTAGAAGAAPQLAEALAALGPEPIDLARARDRVLDLLDTAEAGAAPHLAEALAGLHPEPGDLAQARGRVLDLLDTTEAAPHLAEALAGLHPEPGDLAQARGRVLDLLDLLDLLDTAADPQDAQFLAEALSGLEPLPGDLARARGRVLDLLDAALSWRASPLAEVLAGLHPEPGDLVRARDRVLDLLDIADAWSAVFLAAALSRLDPEPDDLAWTRDLMLDLLDSAADPLDTAADCEDAQFLAAVLVEPGPEPDDLVRARGRMLHLLDIAEAWSAQSLAAALSRLGPEPDDLARARGRVLDLLDAAGAGAALELTEALAGLRPEPGDLARARGRVLDLLDAAGAGAALELTEALAGLRPEPGDLARTRGRVLDLLDTAADPVHAQFLAEALARLGPEPGDLARARGRVLDLLDTAEAGYARRLAEALGKLGPEPGDLARACARVAPERGLLAATRQNSPLRSWLDVLPALGRPHGT